MGQDVAEFVDVSVIEAQDKAQIDSQVATARAYPRDVKTFLRELEEWSCSSQEIAEDCYYRLTRQGTAIEGPSVRFAELIAASYTNLICAVRILPEEREYVIAEALVRDVQRNVTQRSQVRRRITTKTGSRYGADMIGVTAQAASSIALRNAIMAAVPKALWSPVWEKSRAIALGSVTDDLTIVRTKNLEWLRKAGAAEENILHRFGKEKRDELIAEDVAELKQIAKAIHSGETTVEREFPGPKAGKDKESDKKQASAAGEALGKSKKKAAAKKGKEPELTEDGDEIPDDAGVEGL